MSELVAVFSRKKQLWGAAFWSRSSYVGSVGDMSVDTVLKYLELGQAYNGKTYLIFVVCSA